MEVECIKSLAFIKRLFFIFNSILSKTIKRIVINNSLFANLYCLLRNCLFLYKTKLLREMKIENICKKERFLRNFSDRRIQISKCVKISHGN